MSQAKRKFVYDLIREECRQSYSVECPICRDDVTEGLTILKPCGHVFCRPCIVTWSERVVKSPKTKCPLCCQVIKELSHFNSVTFATLAPYRHDKCGFLCGMDDTSKSLIYSLSKEWLRLVRFMFKTHSDPSNFQGVKGIEHLNLRSVKDGAISSKSVGHIGYTKSSSEDCLSGRFGLVICTLLPNLSVMLLLRDDDSFEDVDANNEYADQVVHLFNEQMIMCWRDMKEQLPRAQRFMYVRKFERVTCSLLLVPGGWNKTSATHCRPFLKDIRTLKTCNFDPVHLSKIQKYFPGHVPNNLAMGPGYVPDRCCQRLTE